jgi:hypothetical protein
MPTNIKSATSDPSYSGSYSRAVTITANDSTDLAEPTRAIHIHHSTNSTPVKVTFLGDTTPVVLNLQTGFVFPLRVSRIWATGTTASTIIALY